MNIIKLWLSKADKSRRYLQVFSTKFVCLVGICRKWFMCFWVLWFVKNYNTFLKFHHYYPLGDIFNLIYHSICGLCDSKAALRASTTKILKGIYFMFHEVCLFELRDAHKVFWWETLHVNRNSVYHCTFKSAERRLVFSWCPSPALTYSFYIIKKVFVIAHRLNTHQITKGRGHDPRRA